LSGIESGFNSVGALAHGPELGRRSCGGLYTQARSCPFPLAKCLATTVENGRSWSTCARCMKQSSFPDGQVNSYVTVHSHEVYCAVHVFGRKSLFIVSALTPEGESILVSVGSSWHFTIKSGVCYESDAETPHAETRSESSNLEASYIFCAVLCTPPRPARSSLACPIRAE